MPAPPWDLDTAPPDIAVLVVLAEEFACLAARYGTIWFPRPNPTYGGSDYFWIDPASGYRCVAGFSGRMSPEEAVQLANRLLAHRPATLVNVGIAAGLHGDVKIGDVVVPDLVVAYDKTTKVRPRLAADGSELADEWTFERRADGFRATHALVEAAKNLAFAHHDAFERWREQGRADFRTISTRSPTTQAAITELLGRRNPVVCAEPELHVATLASGHAVVASEAFAKWVREGNADIKALEMEAAGMLLAAEKRVGGPSTLVIRGISDHSAVDKAKTEAIEAGALRGLAMRNALGVFELLMATNAFTRVGAGGRAPEGAPAKPRESAALELWREKLDFLLAHEPLAVDPAAKFKLRKDIEEARAHIRALGGES